MVFRVSMAIFGISIATIGGVGLVAYSNLIVSGYSLYEFWEFISVRAELYLLLGGLLVSFISLTGKKKKKQANLIEKK
ncbi:hypothetical protein [Geomicrobium sp. JCM 19039]|uniref:hypothetical protein n=1 Tax=Geomicrobium sp. JCM 19039 TaxID=1460636 RepID=UPI00045F30F2|nr:hypothetical protein [Geomicrobium sp. JCM 19039]GAK11851.1 hypothetical protein JCM19039_1571 [Geomicrobium sp. JCM 19039]